MLVVRFSKPLLFNLTLRPCSQLHTSAACCTKAWRARKGLPSNKTSFGPLTDLPDYTFLDGRPTPIGGHQRQRMDKQREMARKIVTLTAEVDFAVTRHKEMLAEKEAIRNKIIANRLKEKGFRLLKKSESSAVGAGKDT